jgi:hypothetical protein
MHTPIPKQNGITSPKYLYLWTVQVLAKKNSKIPKPYNVGYKIQYIKKQNCLPQKSPLGKGLGGA